MNGGQLIERVLGIVQDPSFDDDAALSALNQGLLAVASRVLLPVLGGGQATVVTAVGENTVDLPVNYHRGLFLATAAGRPVGAYTNKALMLASTGILIPSLIAGTVRAVAVDGGRLLYQRVPIEETDIELFYYRVPSRITASSASVDGLSVNGEANDHFEMAIVHYAASELFGTVEGGQDQKKSNTLFHAGKYEQLVAEIDTATSAGRPRPAPPICRMTSW